MRLRLLMLGKTRRPELRAVFDDYVKRISRSAPVEVSEVRDAGAAIKRLDSDRAATAILLDARGTPQDSEALLAQSDDLLTRTCPRHARGAALSRFRHSFRQPLPQMTRVV